jgi:hypothetical protein
LTYTFFLIIKKIVFLHPQLKIIDIMPTLSVFFGLIIRMYFAPREHYPPHIHVEYQGEDTIVDIASGRVISGHLSPRHLRFVQAWIEIHKEDLIVNWDLCQNGEEPFRIEPLR